jgi:hypothetical protein
MSWVGKYRARSANAGLLFVVLFAILLVFSTAAQVAHVHADGAAHSDCALCKSAHGVAQVPFAACVQQVFVVSTRVVARFERPYREHSFSFSHWNRPPPDQTAVS